ncbi:OTOP3 protein, partial [Chionis minor]|nr:OTOP3 protein [Chionis minor]
MSGNRVSKQKPCQHCKSRSPSAPPGTAMIHYEKFWLYRHCSSVQQRDMQAQKAGQLFSGLLAMNVVFLGSAFISSMIFNHVAITLADVWILLSILKVLCLCWITYYLLGTSRQPHAVLYRDSHAGPIWIRGSVLLFGSFSILLNVFQIGYSAILMQCKSRVEIVFPSIEILFICTQALFLWHHSKDCIQVQHNFTRCGLMLTIATNLLLWLLAVTNDTIHMEIESQLREVEQRFEGKAPFPRNESAACTCPNTTICKVFQKGYILLYPFNTEYCLVCCSVLYVMWKNVGRRISHHHIPHIKPKFKLQGVVFGPLLGISAVIIGICIFMLYQIQATGSAPNHQVFVMYYSYYIVLLPLMSVGAVIGTIIHALEKKELDTLKNPTRSLDVVLLMGAALGQIGMSYFSIVAIVATDPRDLLNSLILSHSVLLIFQNITQNIFIIDGLHRQPFAAAIEARPTGHAGEQAVASELPGEEETTSSSNQEHTEMKEEQNHEAYDQRRVNMLELGQEIRKVSLSYIHSYSHLSWKRRALREISFFLVLCNIILWVMPTFGAHPVFENGLEKSFYGYSTWFAIVNFGLPLGVFYRMHSVGGLLEVYVTA